MKKNKVLKIYEAALLILVWVVLLASPVFFTNGEYLELNDFFKPIEVIAPLFILFILNRFLLVPQLLFKKKSLYYFLSVAGLIVLFTFGSYLVSQNAEQRMPPPPREEQWRRPPHDQIGDEPNILPFNDERDERRGRPIPPYANLLIFSFLLIGFDTGLRGSFRLAETERKKAKLEVENVGSQLAFLRNQVSPHFFMNTLNNIHSLIDIDTEEAKESIIRLSKLMRHLLYESDIERIPIQKEVDFIRNYVDLMKLRYSEKVKINLMFPDQIPEKSIPPLLFTSFLDNAFKHGVSYQQDSFIVIAMTIVNDNLIFEVRNSLSNSDKEEKSSGIGIENSSRRLDLIYKNTYTLDIDEQSESYYVKLTIPL